MKISDIPVTGPAVILCVIVLCTGVGCLGWSLHHSDPVTEHQFRMLGDLDQTWKPGAWIELARLGLALLGLIAIGVKFPKTLRQLLHVWDPITWHPLRLTFWARGAFLALAIVWGGSQAAQQFDTGPTGPAATGVQWGMDNGTFLSHGRQASTLQETFSSTGKSAKIYIINYLLFFALCIPLALVVPAFSFLREDWKDLRRIRDRLTAPEGDTLSDFKKLRLTILEHSKRYTRLLAITGLVVAFEQYVGFHVMPADNQIALPVAFAIVAVYALLLLVFGYYYYECYQAAQRSVSGDDEAVQELDSDYSPRQFIKLLLKYDLSGVVAVALLISPFKEHFPSLVPLLGG